MAISGARITDATLLGRTRAITPLVSGLKTLQAGGSRGQIDVLPFWIE
jgi:hypothetical protein